MIAKYEQRRSTLTVTHNQGLIGYPIRFHKDLELLFLEEGSLEMLIDGVRYTMGPGDLCIVFPNMLHSILAQHSDKYLIMVSPVLLPEFGKQLSHSKPVCPLVTADRLPPIVGQLFRRCSQLRTDEKDRSLLICHVASILGEVLRIVPLQQRSSDPELVQRIVEFVVTRYSEDISLTQLAEAVGYSKFYVSRCLNDTFGCNFRALVNNYRIDTAEQMLLHSRDSVADIAYGCGFLNLSSFNRAFLKYCGISPTAYRKARQ